MYKLSVHKKDNTKDEFNLAHIFDVTDFLQLYVLETMEDKNYMEIEFTLTKIRGERSDTPKV